MRATAEISSYGWAYSVYTDLDYDNGDTYTIPEGEELVWALIDFNALAIQMYDGAGWVSIEVDEGVVISMAIDKPLVMTSPLYSFGGTAVGSVRMGTPATNNHVLKVCTRKWEQI